MGDGCQGYKVMRPMMLMRVDKEGEGAKIRR